MNTVIPLDNYALYNAARTNIAIAENTVLKLTDATVLDPSLGMPTTPVSLLGMEPSRENVIPGWSNRSDPARRC